MKPRWVRRAHFKDTSWPDDSSNQLPLFAGKGENVCIDRCVAKYLDIHERIGKKLTSLSTPDAAAQ